MPLCAHLNTKQMYLNYKDFLENVHVSTKDEAPHGKEISLSSLLHLVALLECSNERVWSVLRRAKATRMLTPPTLNRICLK